MFTSFMQPKYQDNKNDDKKYENSSKCFPNHLITLAAFSFCKEDQGWKVKSKNAHNIKEYSGLTLLLLLSINGCRWWQERQNINMLKSPTLRYEIQYVPRYSLQFSSHVVIQLYVAKTSILQPYQTLSQRFLYRIGYFPRTNNLIFSLPL